MKNLLKISLCLLAATSMLTACDNDDKWAPGPQDYEVGVEAYFPEQSTSVILSPINPLEFTAVVKRVETQNAVSIPMSVTCTAQGLTYPQTVDFAAGQDEAQFVVDCSGLPVGEFQTVTIALPDNETNVYGDGMSSLSLSVIVAEWKEIADNVVYYYKDSAGTKLWPNTSGTMMHLENTNYFLLTDFFASGLDVMFEVTSPSGQNFTPITNAYWMTDDYGYNIWYLYDEANNEWIDWYPDSSSSLGITYLDAYGDGYSKVYMLYDASSLYGYGSVCGYLMFTDDSWSGWMNMQFDFNLKYNPFE